MFSSIVAMRNGTPSCNVIYDHKQIGLLRQMSLLDLTIPINKVTCESLHALVERVIRNRLEINETIEKNLAKSSSLSKMIIMACIKAVIF